MYNYIQIKRDLQQTKRIFLNKNYFQVLPSIGPNQEQTLYLQSDPDWRSNMYRRGLGC